MRNSQVKNYVFFSCFATLHSGTTTVIGGKRKHENNEVLSSTEAKYGKNVSGMCIPETLKSFMAMTEL